MLCCNPHKYISVKSNSEEIQKANAVNLTEMVEILVLVCYLYDTLTFPYFCETHLSCLWSEDMLKIFSSLSKRSWKQHLKLWEKPQIYFQRLTYNLMILDEVLLLNIITDSILSDHLLKSYHLIWCNAICSYDSSSARPSRCPSLLFFTLI